MQSEIVITNITDSDVDEIIKIGLSTPELQLKADEPTYYSEEMLSSFIKSPQDIYLVAKVNGKIAGYRLATFNPFLKEAYLIDLVVKSEYRGLGVATKLYEKTFATLNTRDCHRVWVLAKEGNMKILPFLSKYNFIKGDNFTAFFKTSPF